MVKVGFSLKDPTLRVAELDGTGLPYRFDVACEVLVYEPRTVEQLVHGELDEYREAKEFFRCTVGQVVAAIRLHGLPLAMESGLLGQETTSESRLPETPDIVDLASTRPRCDRVVQSPRPGPSNTNHLCSPGVSGRKCGLTIRVRSRAAPI